MKKDALVDELAKGAGITKRQANDALGTLTDVVTKALKSKKRVPLPGLGTFYTSHSDARTGPNPQRPGEKIQIPARYNAKFKAGKALKDAVK
ncbi:MAG: HU family DNA-binding protein [Candidatus Spechtbacteria bacterium SB0662_bin_43]|uniref:HU family DNA-binding protein n=1 Tax=Candidatus Spechtbacteria bacterium SB0662_bin_43 TaxID=2604897 RepID=A0A845DA14_9BACT|nr:HU family DNA-binding protein [Candidatus Spechtbacteria bacterium SB0662_bin_43]